MTWAVAGWRQDFPGFTVEWEVTSGGGPQSQVIAGSTFDALWGWRSQSGSNLTGATTSAVGRLATALQALLALAPVTGAVGSYAVPSRNLLHSVALVFASPVDYFRLVFSSIAAARVWGYNATTVTATLSGGGGLGLLESTINVAGGWNGGCVRVAQDEPDVAISSQVSASPYTPGQSTHVVLGEQTTRAVRWVHVDAAFVHALQAGESDFALQADRNVNDPNNLLETLVRQSASGALLVLLVQNRAAYEARVLDSDPSVSTYARRGSRSGRRYDVEMTFSGLA